MWRKWLDFFEIGLEIVYKIMIQYLKLSDAGCDMGNLKDELIVTIKEKKQTSKKRKEEHAKEVDREELQNLIAKADAMSPEERKVFAEEIRNACMQNKLDLVETRQKVDTLPKKSKISNDFGFALLLSSYVGGGGSLAIVIDQLFKNNAITIASMCVVFATAMAHFTAIDKNAFNNLKGKGLKKQAKDLTREIIIQEKLTEYLDKKDSDTMER